MTKSGPCGQQGRGGPGRGPKHEIHVHTGCAKQELNEDVICSFWKLKVMQMCTDIGGNQGSSLTLGITHSTPSLSAQGVWADWRKRGTDAAGVGGSLEGGPAWSEEWTVFQRL